MFLNYYESEKYSVAMRLRYIRDEQKRIKEDCVKSTSYQIIDTDYYDVAEPSVWQSQSHRFGDTELL